MRRVETCRGDAGFTLLEVLVALVVLALALVALTRTAAHETAQFDALRQRTVAGWVAANVLTETRLEPGMPALGRRDGQRAMAHRTWRYRLNVSSTPASGIRKLHVEVYAPGDAGPRAAPLIAIDGFAGQGTENRRQRTDG